MEQEQFRQEILPLRKQLLFYAQRLLEISEDAEDIIQEVFLKLWQIRGELNKYESIPALSMQITKNLCLNRLKVAHRNQNSIDAIDSADHSIDPHLLLEQKDEVIQVMKIIDHLPDAQQLILRMKHIECLELSEIAKITGSKPEAIRMNLSRARKKVKELFFKIQSK